MTSKDIKKKAKELEPVIRIGKNGLNEPVVEEIKKQLKKKRLIKVKFLRSALEDKDKKEAFSELASKIDGKIVLKTGFVLVLQKE
ncbi:RNA-binding protein [Candidatus Woesearchaeota archaeon]|nr:RNA-binding protein [Candidatus Woesearchaeota archaeon]